MLNQSSPAQPAPHLSGPSRTSAVFSSADWLRLPRPGERCPISGLSRSGLVELVRPCERNGFRPPVEARHLRRKGTQRGVVLVSAASLRDYLATLPSLTESLAARDGEKGGNDLE
jgi:hypothetical protein